ncbi:MAG: glycosyltransferase [Candidatus Omnitrophica bacterium]|nr:glycosyltransferase [Candidatus Omnitrophota bacterium]MDE2223456.1 glycosyltransferase [Candidatus Omnitrophota bacterium]
MTTDQNKRLCFVTTLPVTITDFLVPQTQYLIEKGWDVTWISANDPGLGRVLPKGTPHYIPLPFRRSMGLFGILRLTAALYRIFRRERFSIVQYSTPAAAFCAGTAARLAHVPVRLYAQWGIGYAGFRGLRRLMLKALERWCCRCSTHIEPDSTANLEFSLKEGLYGSAKGRVIMNGSACGVDLDRFDIAKKCAWRSEYRRKLGFGDEDLVVGFVGSICSDKGCHELINACRSLFSAIPRARLLVIGHGDPLGAIEPGLYNWIFSSRQVKVITPNPEIPQYLACMDVLSLPGGREGFGSVIVEAEAMGVPVVASSVPAPVDAMQDGVTGLLVPVRGSRGLAAALKSLLSDEEKRLALGRAAVGFARENFDQKRFLEAVLSDKNSLLAG